MNRGPAKRARTEAGETAEARQAKPPAPPLPKIEGLSRTACDFLRGVLQNQQIGYASKDAEAIVELKTKLGIAATLEE